MVDVFEPCCAARSIRSIVRSQARHGNARMDNVLDRLDTAIKEYLTSIDIDALDDTDHRRLSEFWHSRPTLSMPAISSRRA